MNKKKKKLQNSNGITICDSIVMSVRHKRPNYRSLEAVLIAVMGYVSAIMAFLKMFSFKYDPSRLFFAGIIFSAVYIYSSLCGKKGSYFTLGSCVVAMFYAYKNITKLSLGFKFMYNTIYHAAYRTEIEYYKFLRPSLEKDSVTTLFIVCAWLIAVVVYYFTINRPNSVMPVLVTFPLMEVGLYNGIKMPIFWGVMVVAYWLAILAMSNTDIGEYSGGNGGFVRKDNIFFPKRQMRLKVTEKCGAIVILTTVCAGALASGAIKLSHYKRSDEMNKKRIEIRDAVNSFSMDNLAESVSGLTTAFGLDFKYENHHLGNVDRLRYKDTTDLVVAISGNVGGAVYLKDYTGSLYEDNQWTDLPESAYSDQVFEDFDKYGIAPQSFPEYFGKFIDEDAATYTLTIESNLKSGHRFEPYFTVEGDSLRYDKDKGVITTDSKSTTFRYRFMPMTNDQLAARLQLPVRNVFYSDAVMNYEDRKMIEEFCQDKELLSFDNYFSVDSEIPAAVNELYDYPDAIMSQLLQAEYKEFVYANYLTIPDGTNMDEVYAHYKDILESPDNSAASRLEKLTAIREKMTSEVTYSLDPGRTPSNRDFVNYFLLENKKGYCTHYATSGVILARMAGIPARYVTGYVIVGDDFNNDNLNSDGSYTINVKDNRCHAWTEVYLDGYGWVPFEFTAGYSSQTIDTTPPPTEASTEDMTDETAVNTSPQETTAPARSTSGASKTTGNSESETTSAAETETTAAETTKSGAGLIGDDNGSVGQHRELPTAVKNVIRTVLLIAAFAAFVLIRRWIKLRIRLMHFTTGSNSSRISYIYDYTESLLKISGREKGDMPYAEFAAEIEGVLGGRYFDEGRFYEFMETALRAGFDATEPDSEELKNCRKFADELAEKFYERKNWLSRIVMKYITVLK